MKRVANYFSSSCTWLLSVERHVTLDRTMFGTDQSASIEPKGLKYLVRDINIICEALGDGEKKVTAIEQEMAKKMRV